MKDNKSMSPTNKTMTIDDIAAERDLYHKEFDKTNEKLENQIRITSNYRNALLLMLEKT